MFLDVVGLFVSVRWHIHNPGHWPGNSESSFAPVATRSKNHARCCGYLPAVAVSCFGDCFCFLFFFAAAFAARCCSLLPDAAAAAAAAAYKLHLHHLISSKLLEIWLRGETRLQVLDLVAHAHHPRVVKTAVLVLQRSGSNANGNARFRAFCCTCACCCKFCPRRVARDRARGRRIAAGPLRRLSSPTVATAAAAYRAGRPKSRTLLMALLAVERALLLPACRPLEVVARARVAERTRLAVRLGDPHFPP